MRTQTAGQSQQIKRENLETLEVSPRGGTGRRFQDIGAALLSILKLSTRTVFLF